MTGLFLLVALAVLGVGLYRFLRNESSPTLTQDAVVVRRLDDTHLDPNGVMQETWALEFEIDGQRLRTPVPHRVYRAIPQGSIGRLTHQGTRFYRFDWDGQTVEK